VEGEPDDEGDRERHREPGEREPQHRATQPVDLDLKAGQEEQEADADQREHVHCRVGMHPSEHRRAQRHARADLKQNRRHAQGGDEPEEKRRGERHGRDGREVVEADGIHAAAVAHGRRLLHARV
jgi:hypothetical protein